jgi:hypothetical protein
MKIMMKKGMSVDCTEVATKSIGGIRFVVALGVVKNGQVIDLDIPVNKVLGIEQDTVLDPVQVLISNYEKRGMAIDVGTATRLLRIASKTTDVKTEKPKLIGEGK